MTYDGTDNPGPENHRRAATRDKARAIREEQRKKESRNRLLLRSGIAVAIVAIAAIVVIVLTTSASAPSTGPVNMASDGIVISKDFKAVPTQALTKGEDPIATVRDKKSSVVSIRLYVDYFCPTCQSFESANRVQLSKWLKSGAITLEVHPISLLDRSSLGTAYSTRAANAAACVANYSPDEFWAFTQALYAKPPQANTAGLSNGQLIDAVSHAKAHSVARISACINSEKFKAWVADATSRATTGPLPDSSVKAVSGPLTVIVDGQQYPITTSDVGSAAAFAAFVEETAGAQFDSGGSSSSPSPTPSPTPTTAN